MRRYINLDFKNPNFATVWTFNIIGSAAIVALFALSAKATPITPDVQPDCTQIVCTVDGSELE
jgi:hypothetical protein